MATAKKNEVGIRVVGDIIRPAGWITPGDPPCEYELKLYANPDEYLQYRANRKQIYDKWDVHLVMEDLRTGAQKEKSRKKHGPWGWGLNHG